MNLIEIQDNLKNLSDQQLAQEMQMPSGNAPQYLVLSELQRRQDMRKRFQSAQAKAPSTTVAEDALAGAGVPQGGIAQMARSMAPQSAIAQNTGIGALAQPTMPTEEPQRMAGGGMVRKMQEGRSLNMRPRWEPVLDPVVRGGPAVSDPAIIAMANRMGMSVSEFLLSVGEEEAARLQADAARRSTLDRMNRMQPVLAQPVASDFTSVNPSYVENLNPVFPDETIAPEGGGLAIEPQPLYPQNAVGNPIPGVRPEGGFYDSSLRPVRPEPMSPMERLRAEMAFDETGEGVRASIPQRERDYAQYVLDNPSLQDMTENQLRAGRIAAGPGLGEFFTDTGEAITGFVRDAGGTLSRGAGDALAYLNMPGAAEYFYNNADDIAALSAQRDADERQREAATAAEQKMFEDEQARRAALLLGAGGGGADAGQAAAIVAPAVDTEAAAPAVPTEPPVETTAPNGGVQTPGGNIISPVEAASTSGIGALTGTGSGGTGRAAASAAPSSYEQQLMDAMTRADKRAKQDKWMALAEAGMALMASDEPTIMGALGEAGIAGLKGYRTARDEGESTRLGFEKALYDLRSAQAAAAQRAAGAASSATSLDKVLGGLSDVYEHYTYEVEQEDPVTGQKTTVRVARPGAEDIVKAIEQREFALGRSAYPLIAGQ